MENLLEVFEHEQFGKIRVVMINGEPWFVAADICKALDLKNPSDILKRLDDDEKSKIPEDRVVVDPILNIGSEKREVNIVNEPGLYRLVSVSRKPEAKKFQRWVYHEVLPTIRKTGSYSLPKTAAKPAPNPKRREAQIRAAFVYVLLMSDGTVKIGHSSNVITRTSKIERERKLKAKQVYFTFSMSREEARLVEWAFKKNFSSRRVEGEFFSVAFEEACAAVDLLAKNLFVSSIREHLTYTAKISVADKKLD